MTAPLDFLALMRRRLHESGIRFALTSGMACLHFGLQQTTKDSDWIIEPDHLDEFRVLLGSFAAVSYRPIFGAPLDPAWMAHGWTSHVSVLDEPGSPRHHVDVFSRPPALPLDPLGEVTRAAILDTGLRRAAAHALQPLEVVLDVAPPISELLP